MPRKLKVYQTSQGFYDLAIAAPSMKAALEAWGAGSNLFHQGFAKESDDDKVIAAAITKPGIVLLRPVGSDAPFREHAELPTTLSVDAKPRKDKARPPKLQARKTRKVDEKAERRAADLFEKERARREQQLQKEEEAAAKANEQRKAAIMKAKTALEAAAREHEEKAAQLEKELRAVQRRAEAEENRWLKTKARLETAVRKASG